MKISIHPSFWVATALFGYFFSGSFFYAALFVFVACVSVLVHELGHASMALLYGLKPRVQLYALGGVTEVPMTKMSLLQEFGFVMMGPLFGALFAGIFGAISIYSSSPNIVVTLFYELNVLWTVINLLPVHPLDGGRLMSIFFQWVAGESGLRFSYFLSMLFALLFGGLFFAYSSGLMIMGALFMMFAFDSFRAFRDSKGQITDEQAEKLTTILGTADVAWMKGEHEEALHILRKELQALPEQSQAFYELLAIYCRYLTHLKRFNTLVETLLPLQKKLNEPLQKTLQFACFQVGKYEEVLQLGAPLFVETHDKEVARLNSEAALKLGRNEEAINWQQSAS